MKQNPTFLTRSFLAMFFANIISNILPTLGSTVLSAFIGKRLGETELAVFGIVMPLIMLAVSLNTIFTMGLIPVAARYIGEKQGDRASSVFSTSLITTFVIAGILSLSTLFLSSWITDMLTSNTANDVEQIRQLCVICLRVLSCTILLTSLDTLLTSALLVDNGKLLITIGSIAMILTRIGLALLYILVLKGGLVGTMLTIPISLIIKIVILLLYFKRKKRVFHFIIQGVQIRKLKEVILCGLPQMLQIFTTFAKSIVFNKLLLNCIGSYAVAAFTISGSLDQLITVFSISAMTTTSALCGMLYQEDYQATLKDLLKTSLLVSSITMWVVGFPILLFTEKTAGLFLEGNGGEVLPIAVWFIRCTIIMLFMQTLCSVMSGIYIGTRQYVVNYITEILRNLIFPLAMMIPGVLLAKETGFGLGLAGYNVLSLITVFLVVPLIFNKKFPLDLKYTMTFRPGSQEGTKYCGDK